MNLFLATIDLLSNIHSTLTNDRGIKVLNISFQAGADEHVSIQVSSYCVDKIIVGLYPKFTSTNIIDRQKEYYAAMQEKSIYVHRWVHDIEVISSVDEDKFPDLYRDMALLMKEMANV